MLCILFFFLITKFIDISACFWMTQTIYETSFGSINLHSKNGGKIWIYKQVEIAFHRQTEIQEDIKVKCYLILRLVTLCCYCQVNELALSIAAGRVVKVRAHRGGSGDITHSFWVYDVRECDAWSGVRGHGRGRTSPRGQEADSHMSEN